MTPSPRAYDGTKRKSAREATRNRIVAAAETVLVRNGWAGFSLEAVAAEAGVTRMTVYHHFGARRALLEAVFDARAQAGGFAGIAAAMSEADPHVALERIVVLFCRFWRSARGSLQGVMVEAMADPEFAEAMTARNERRRMLMRALVERLADRGAIDPARKGGLTDTLFALTGFPLFAELAAGRQDAAEVEETLKGLALAAVALARPVDA